MGHQQPLIDQGAVGQAANIEIVGVLFADAGVGQAVFDDLAKGVKLALQPAGVKQFCYRANKELADGGLHCPGVPAQLGRIHRNVAPAQQG